MPGAKARTNIAMRDGQARTWLYAAWIVLLRASHTLSRLIALLSQLFVQALSGFQLDRQEAPRCRVFV